MGPPTYFTPSSQSWHPDVCRNASHLGGCSPVQPRAQPCKASQGQESDASQVNDPDSLPSPTNHILPRCCLRFDRGGEGRPERAAPKLQCRGCSRVSWLPLKRGLRKAMALPSRLHRSIQAVHGKIGTTTIGPPLPLARVRVRSPSTGSRNARHLLHRVAGVFNLQTSDRDDKCMTNAASQQPSSLCNTGRHVQCLSLCFLLKALILAPACHVVRAAVRPRL